MIKNYSKNYFWLGISLILLILPNVYLTIHGSYFEETSIVKKLIFLLLSGVLICTPLIFFNPKTYLIIGIIFIFAVPFELVNIYLYRTTLNSGIILSIFNTSLGEATELLNWILPMILIGVFLITSYILLVFKKIPYQFSLFWNVKRVFAIAAIITVVGLWMRDIFISHNTHRDYSFNDVINDGFNNYINKYSKIFPFSTIIQTSRALTVVSESKKYEERVANFYFQSYKKDSFGFPERYVLVIGESSRSANYQLYGYNRNTNPELSKIKGIEVFSNFIANSNLTNLCFPLLLTRATPDSFDISNKEKSFISCFKECGFKTFWISNQGLYNSNIVRLMLDVDKIYNLYNSFDLKDNYDEKIFPFLDEILNRQDNKQLVIINLMGSHFRYNFRYPEKFNIFKPGFDGNFDYMTIKPSNREKLVNIYDNSILYTDYILASIINKLQKKRSASIMVYLSDHGESLYDDGEMMFGHGNNNPSQYEIKIPFIVWHSFQYDSLYPNKIKVLHNNRNIRASSSNLFHTLVDGANIDFESSNISKSLFSVDFKEDSVRKVLVPNLNLVQFDKK